MQKSLRALLVVLLVAGGTQSAKAQAEPNYYVVIGVFAKLDNAVRYTDQANQKGFSAQYAIHSRRQWNYV